MMSKKINHHLTFNGKNKSVCLNRSLSSHRKPRDMPSHRKPHDEKSDSGDGFYYPTLTLIIDSYSVKSGNSRHRLNANSDLVCFIYCILVFGIKKQTKQRLKILLGRLMRFRLI